MVFDVCLVKRQVIQILHLFCRFDFQLYILNIMGCMNTAQAKLPDPLNKTTLTVATLNYCGIMNSPFEFYCEEYQEQLKEISSIFVSLLPKYFPKFNKDKFKWQMGKIDQKLRVGRYSTMFSGEVGIQNGKFVNRSDFQKKWEQVFAVQSAKINLQYQPNQKQATKLYDIIGYHTMLRYVYKINQIQQALNKDPQIYRKKLQPFYNLSFLNEDRKVKKMVDKLSKLEADIFFFQEYSDYLHTYLVNRREHYISVDQTKDTMIIAKQTSFQKKKDLELVLNHLTKEQKESIKLGETSAYLCLDNYIFVSLHLSSKQAKNKVQIEQLKQNFINLKKYLPEYEIIAGGDLNSYLPPFSKDFHMYPQDKSELTTIKKRTSTQGQFNKAQKIVQDSKDKIISSLKIQTAHTMYINGQLPSKQSYVPSDQHPFDHFAIVAHIKKST